MSTELRNKTIKQNAINYYKPKEMHSIRLSKEFATSSNVGSHNRNCIVVGSKGCGKTNGLIIPNILKSGDSFVVLDKNSEILDAFQKKDKDTSIYILDLENKENKYNPFDYIENKEDASRFTNCLYQLIEDRDFVDGADKYWKEQEYKLLTSYVKFITYGYGFNPLICGNNRYEKNLRGLYRLSMSGSIREYVTNAKKLLGKLPSCFNVFDEVDEKTMTSLISMLAMNLGVFVTEEVQVLTEKSSFHLNELYNKEKRVGLFIELEGDMKENSFATMVIWQIADKMKNMKEQGEVAKYVVNFYLDNFDMIPRLPDAEQLFVGSRTSMYNFILCLQDLTNLANKYFDKTPFILMNSPFYVFYPNSMDEKTVEFVEEYAKNSVEGVSEEVVDYLKEVYSIFRSGYVMIATPKFPIFVDTALHEDGYVEVTEA